MGHRILVAEDSPTQAERIRFLLEGEGHVVEVVGNGREGLERVRSAAPELIISDIEMPVMDGFAFCRALKTDEATKSIPFVLLTSHRTPFGQAEWYAVRRKIRPRLIALKQRDCRSKSLVTNQTTRQPAISCSVDAVDYLVLAISD